MSYNWFAGMFQRGSNKLAISSTNYPLLNLPENEMITLQNCQDIYTYWGLGKRIIHALPRFAFSAPREIVIQDCPPEAVSEFTKVSERLKQDRIIRRASIFCRMYGMAGLYVAYNNNDVNAKPDLNEAEKNLSVKEVQSGKIAFNALNPLNLSGTVFNQDALSTRFQRPETIIVKGVKVGSRRATVIQNSEPVYLRFTNATFSFSGISVYQNMIRLIKAWTRAVISLERMATKGSSIIFKDGARGKMSGLQADAATKSLERIRDMENNGATSIDKDGDVAFFNLTGVTEVDIILKSLEREIMMALDDTPAAILLDKNLSSGLSEGAEDMKALIMAVDNFREEILTPLYAFTDPYVQAVAWTDDFINSVIKKHPKQYTGYTTSEIRQLWQESFTFEYGNLYPEPEKDVQETNGVKLDNLKKAYDMGAEVADIEAEIKESKIFKNEVALNPRPTPILGEFDDEENKQPEEE